MEVYPLAPLTVTGIPNFFNSCGRSFSIRLYCFSIFKNPPYSSCVAQQPTAIKESASPRCASLTAAFCRADRQPRRRKAVLCQKALTGYDSVYMTHSFPLAGRADGEKRKEPHDGKNLPIPTSQKPVRISAFMRH